jgi:hypothetical protein
VKQTFPAPQVPLSELRESVVAYDAWRERVRLQMSHELSESPRRIRLGSKRAVFDCFLLLVVLSGAVVAWQTGQERSRLNTRHERLFRIAGELLVEAASKLYVHALDTGETLHFAWRVYCPPNKTILLSSRQGDQGLSLSNRSSDEFIARVRLRCDDRGFMRVFIRVANGSSTEQILGDQKLATLLRGHWGKIRVEQLGFFDDAITASVQHSRDLPMASCSGSNQPPDRMPRLAPSRALPPDPA